MEENQSVVRKNQTFFNKISFGILLLLTFLSPLFFLPFSAISTQFGSSLLFGFSVILVTLIYVISGFVSGALELPVGTKYILGLMTLVPFVYTLAGVANGFSRMPFFGYTFDIATVGFIILAFIYLFLVSILFRSKKAIFKSYTAFALSAAILTIFILLRLFLGAGFLSFGLFNDVTSTVLGSWNNVGIFFGIVLLLSLVTHETLNLKRSKRFFLLIVMALSGFFLLLVNFNALWAVIAGLVFLFILYNLFIATPTTVIGNISIALPRMSWKQKLTRLSFWQVAVLVLSLVFAFWPTSFGTYLPNKLHIVNVDVRPTLSTTLDIARSTLQTRPLFGSGPDTFGTQWLTWRPDDINTTVFWNTDFTSGIGLIPTFAVTEGIVGIVSWLIFLGFFVYLGIKAIFVKIEDSHSKYLIVSSFFVSLYLWVMMFVYVPSTVIFVLTFFFTGLFFASGYATGILGVHTVVFSDSPRRGFVSTLIMVIVFLVVIVLGYGLFKNSESVWYFQKSSYALNTSKDIVASEDYMQQAISAVPHDINYRALTEIELTKLNAISMEDPKLIPAVTIQEQFRETLTNAIKAGLAATQVDPSNYLNWVALGNVYAAVSVPQLAVKGAYQSAMDAYSQALRRSPKDPSILLLFARLAVAQNDLTAATSYAEQAIQLKSNYLDAYFLLSQIEVANKDIKGAIAATLSASVINPTDPGIFFQLGLLRYNIADYAGAISALTQATKLTPDYANAKYFLGLSYDMVGEKDKAIGEFLDLRETNPDSTEIKTILENLLAGRPALSNAPNPKPEKGKTLPIKETK